MDKQQESLLGKDPDHRQSLCRPCHRDKGGLDYKSIANLSSRPARNIDLSWIERQRVNIEDRVFRGGWGLFELSELPFECWVRLLECWAGLFEGWIARRLLVGLMN